MRKWKLDNFLQSQKSIIITVPAREITIVKEMIAKYKVLYHVIGGEKIYLRKRPKFNWSILKQVNWKYWDDVLFRKYNRLPDHIVEAASIRGTRYEDLISVEDFSYKDGKEGMLVEHIVIAQTPYHLNKLEEKYAYAHDEREVGIKAFFLRLFGG